MQVYRGQRLLVQLHPSSQVVIFQPPQLHSKLEESVVVYDGAAKLADLKSFVKTSLCVFVPLAMVVFSVCLHSMGLAGVRNPDNRQFFDAQSPLAVVYYDLDYEHNPKGD